MLVRFAGCSGLPNTLTHRMEVLTILVPFDEDDDLIDDVAFASTTSGGEVIM